MFKAQKNTSFGIIGLGRFGTALALKLIEAGCEVIVVDRNENKVKAMREYTDYAPAIGVHHITASIFVC